MRDRAWVHLGLPQAMIAVAHSRAVAPVDLGAAAGFDLALLDEADPAQVAGWMPALWKALVEVLPGAPVGLLVAQQLELAHLGLVGALMQNSANVGDAIRRSLEAQRLLRSAPLWTSQSLPTGDLQMRACVLPWQASLRHPVEALVLGGISTARAIARSCFAPARICFRHPRPHWAADVERWIEGGVEWGATDDGATLPAAVLRQPVPFADAQVADVLQSHAARVLSARDAQAGGQALLAPAVRDTVADVLHDGAPNEANVARRLGLSRRTLQRLLHQEGTSFGALVQSVRHAAALKLLVDPHRTLAEISSALGFSEPSAFHRAFRRWTGDAPGTWRKKHWR